MSGPDIILPSKSYSDVSLNGTVLLRPLELDKIPPISVPSLFHKMCQKYKNRVALNYKKDGKWKQIKYGEYENMVRVCAKAFIKLGLLPNTSVCILGFNSPEWLISDLAAIHAGGVAVGIYTTNSPDACLYCINTSKAIIAVVEDSVQLSKILKIKNKASSLKIIIQYSGIVTEPNVLSWEKVMQLGAEENDNALENALKNIAINRCCTLVFTSGTVGNPKAAMLSHDNVIYDAKKIGEAIKLQESPAEINVSYLPLSHVAANVVDIHATYIHGAVIYFADKDALKGSLFKTLAEVRPTRIVSVPRVWEKLQEKLLELGDRVSGFKKKVAKWAKSVGLKRNLAKERHKSYIGFYFLAKILVFKKVKKKLGLNRCKCIVVGAAPLALSVKHYFASLDIIILETFGMSESSAMHCINRMEDFRFESCGKICDNMLIKIAEPDSEGAGEICMYGRNIFMGYLNDLAKTKEAFDEEGYLRSGDIGKIDNDGFIYITGRIKELLITAGGENIAPVIIEQCIKDVMPFIGNAVVIGDKKKFLSVLLTLSSETDTSGEPTNKLSAASKKWIQGLGFSFETVADVIQSGPHPKIVETIQEGIDAVNKQAISNAQKVQKFVVLPKEFSITTGELGPTLKIKRNIVTEKYKSYIDALYVETTGG